MVSQNHQEILTGIFSSAIRAVDPAELVRERLQKIPISRKLIVVGAGKAAAPMAAAMEEYLLSRITAGCVAVKDGYSLALHKIDLLVAGHPTPDSRSAAAGKSILSLVQGLSDEDVVVALISGGASTLMALPLNGSIEELAKENDRLLNSGLSIREVNKRRRELLALGAGGLAKAAAPAQVIAFILSDVIGNDLATVGSGPTVLETPEPERVKNYLIGDNALAVGSAMRATLRFSLKPQMLDLAISGEAQEFGEGFAQRLQSLPANAALVGGGETTVSLGAIYGKGGRCQEAALSAAIELAGKPGCACLFASTDGTDGPTDAAGAFVDGTTVERAARLGLNPREFLGRHDSYSFFEKLGDLFKPGPTMTNVADLAIGIRL